MIAEDSTVSWVAETEEALRLAKNANEAQREFTNLQDLESSFDTLLTEFKDWQRAPQWCDHWAGTAGSRPRI